VRDGGKLLDDASFAELRQVVSDIVSFVEEHVLYFKDFEFIFVTGFGHGAKAGIATGNNDFFLFKKSSRVSEWNRNHGSAPRES
jgi:hypothetical protein